jgi:hypothetical protein
MKNKKIHNVKKTGFKTPDSYFDSLEDRIFDKLKEDTIFKEIEEPGYATPDSYFESIEDSVMSKLKDDMVLSNIKDSGFKTPDNYFEQVEDSVLVTLNKGKITKVVPLFSRRNIIYVSGIAAAIMIMFGIFLNKPSGIDSLDIEVVESYLEDQGLDTFDIASLLSVEDLEGDDFGIINDNVSEESLEDYLMDNANLEDIIEQ